MLTEKPWKPETMVYLIGALFFCLGAGSLGGHFLMQSEWIAQLGSEEFVTVLVGVIALQIPMFLVIAWFVHFNRTTWSKAFGFSGARLKRLFAMSLITTVLGIGLTLVLTLFSDFFMRSVGIENPPVQSTVIALKSTVSVYQKILFGVVAILIAPAVEELLFRGIIYPAIKQLGHKRAAIWGTSILFGIIHNNVLTALSLIILSVLLILLYEETDNLLAPIIAHSLFNGVNFVWLVYFT